LLEGIHAFYHEPVRKLLDLKVFVNTDDDVRLGRKLVRDIRDRGRTVESVLHQYNSFSRASYNDFIKPTMKYADIIIPYGRENTTATDFLVEIIKIKLKKMGIISEGKLPLTPSAVDNKGQSTEIKEMYKDKDVFDTVHKLLYDFENGHKKYF